MEIRGGQSWEGCSAFTSSVGVSLRVIAIAIHRASGTVNCTVSVGVPSRWETVRCGTLPWVGLGGMGYLRK